MAANGKASEAAPGPKFDFRRVDRGWQYELLRLQAHEARAQKGLALIESGEFTDDELDEALAKAKALDEQRNALIARVLVSVPDEWLIYDAPKDFDPANPAHIQYIRPDYMAVLARGMILAAGNPVGN